MGNSLAPHCQMRPLYLSLQESNICWLMVTNFVSENIILDNTNAYKTMSMISHLSTM